MKLVKKTVSDYINMKNRKLYKRQRITVYINKRINIVRLTKLTHLKLTGLLKNRLKLLKPETRIWLGLPTLQP